jgi:hypothetical protein
MGDYLLWVVFDNCRSSKHFLLLFPQLRLCIKFDKKVLGDRVARFFLVHGTKAGKNVPNEHKMYHMVIEYPKSPQNATDGHKITQHFPIEGTPKFTQIGIFGLKRNHLATLLGDIFHKLI